MLLFDFAIILCLGAVHCAPAVTDKGIVGVAMKEIAAEKLANGIEVLNATGTETRDFSTSPVKRLKREGLFDPVFNIPISILKTVNEHVNTKGTGNHDSEFAIPITALNSVNDLLNKIAGNLPIPGTS